MLPELISKKQSGFVPNCQITNNVMIASVVFHALDQGTSSSLDFLALRLDRVKLMI